MGRIAVLSHTHPSLTKGGAEISAYTLYQGLLALGRDAIFVAAVPWAQRDRLILACEREIPVFYDPEEYDPYYHLAAPAVVNDLEAVLRDNDCEVANFHHFLNFGINGIQRARGIPGLKVALTLHEFLAICHHHGQMVTNPARKLCEGFAPAKCIGCFPELSVDQFGLRRDTFRDTFAALDALISPSRFLAERFHAWGIPAGRIDVIENGLAHVPVPEATPHRQGLPEDAPFVFGYFGQINAFKGVDLILEAVEVLRRRKELPRHVVVRIHGTYVGVSEAFQARVDASAAEDHLLEMAGPYDNAEVTRLMRRCDYVLMASRWWENSPVVIQEAYACGRPLLVPAIGGMAEKVQPGRGGLHFRPSDAQDLAQVLLQAADSTVYSQFADRLPQVSSGKQMAKRYLKSFGV